jgi:hypothetical protein
MHEQPPGQTPTSRTAPRKPLMERLGYPPGTSVVDMTAAETLLLMQRMSAILTGHPLDTEP